MNDGELEEMMRAGLERSAERADVGAPVVARARRAARGARRRRTVVVGLAAASVVAVAGTTVVVGRDAPVPGFPAAAPSPTSAAPGEPTSPGAGMLRGPVRTEYYAGVQVDVPDDWGWGSTPGRSVCGAPPVGVPYVGRPISYTDACSIADPDATPTAPYVWLGADIPTGSVDLGDGWVRETVSVEDTAVSVATQDDSALRDQVLGSVAAQDLCAPTISRPPRPVFESTVEGVGDLAEAHLCAYRRGDGPGLALVYATSLGSTAVEQTFDAVGAAPRAPYDCDASAFETVVVSAAYRDPYGVPAAARYVHEVVYDMSCETATTAAALTGEVVQARLTESTVPWATREFRQLLTGPSEPWAYDYFIGVQG